MDENEQENEHAEHDQETEHSEDQRETDTEETNCDESIARLLERLATCEATITELASRLASTESRLDEHQHGFKHEPIPTTPEGDIEPEPGHWYFKRFGGRD